MPSLRLAVVSIVSLCVGGVIGYWLHPTSAPSTSIGAPKTAEVPAATAVPKSTATTAPVSVDAAKMSAETPGVRSPSIRERLALLRWQRSLGHAPTMQFFSGKGVNLALVKYLDLTPDEQARLTIASRTAEEEVTRLRDANTTSRVSDDPKQLIVDVPGLDPSTSRAIYDRFNAEVAATLDDDRLALLNLLAGESIERLHDRFGLNALRYELTLAPRRIPNGWLVYDYKRSFTEAEGTGTGWVNNTSTLEGITRTDPLLARFLTAALPAEPKP